MHLNDENKAYNGDFFIVCGIYAYFCPEQAISLKENERVVRFFLSMINKLPIIENILTILDTNSLTLFCLLNLTRVTIKKNKKRNSDYNGFRNKCNKNARN
ncbi:MAG: hypothetical protein ACFFC3_02680 [Candidatus Odinarchaeota archaeon]